MLLRPLWFFSGPLALTGDTSVWLATELLRAPGVSHVGREISAGAWALAGFSVERVYETRGIGTWPLLGIAAAVSAATTVIGVEPFHRAHRMPLRPSPGADVGGVIPVPVQMWAG